MSESVIITIIGTVTTILTALLSFFLGQRSERQKQALVIRVQMLNPIEEWLGGADKMIGIVGDTLSTVIGGFDLPITYNLEERRMAAQFMTEKTNIVLGILDSKSLQVRRAKGPAKMLAETILSIDNLIKNQLLPIENEILDRAQRNDIKPDFLQNVVNIKNLGDTLIQKSH
jgi:hypothetical protein